jgi:ATP/maltotriose-dependent transcriptional regulator MalT
LARARGAPDDETDPGLRAQALSTLGYLAGQQFDLERAIALGEAAIALAEPLGDALRTALLTQAHALTLLQSGDPEGAFALADRARPVLVAAGGQDARVAAHDLVRSYHAFAAGDLDLADERSRDAVRLCELADYEPYRCWALLVRARVQERRGELAAAIVECERAVASAQRLGLAHYVAFALAVRGRLSALGGDPAEAQATLARALAIAESARTGWFTAFTRVALADVRAQVGDGAGAEALLRDVLEWSASPGARTGQNSFFLSVGGDPAALATERLAALTASAPA